jgi:hypothetical protein
VNGKLDASISGKNECWTLVVKQGGSRACLGANKSVVISLFFYFTRLEYLTYLEPMHGPSLRLYTTKNMYVNTHSLTLRP